MAAVKHIEILAPVGSFESLQAAINAGAHSIYFGVEQLNMRTKSSNPITIADIKEIVVACRKHGIKTYLTLNTVMYEHDMRMLRTILQEAKDQGVDAVIGADFAVVEYCRQMKMPLHVSTQANVSNIEAVEFFSAFSDVIVLARELTLKQVGQITKEIKRKNITGVSGKPMRIEVFVHGALCMAVSGKCYISLHTQNSSANRGACNQNCRRPYKVTDTETGEALLLDNDYIMSPKDLCTIDILDKVIESGVEVLKIEGRSKGPEYVYTSVKCYREAAEAIAAGTYTIEKINGWKSELEKVYNRGFWEGYYLGRKLGEWTAHPGSAATEKKIYIGKGSNYFSKIKVAEFTVETGSLKAGDSIMVTGPLCGMVKQTHETLFVNGAQASEASKGDKLTFPFDTKVTAKDKLYKILPQ